MTHLPYILLDFGPEDRAQVFANPDDMIVAWDPADVADAFVRMQAAKEAGKWLAGFVSYELGSNA